MSAHVTCMTSPLIILIDIDAPLVLWEEGLVDLARSMFPDVVTPDAGTRLNWDLHEGLTPAEKHVISSVMHAPGFYRDLRPVPGAATAIREMLSFGIEVFLCSTPSLDNPTCASDKLASIAEHYGADIAARTVLTADKTLVIGDLLIDDKPEIKGHLEPTWTQVIFDRAYNQGVPGPRLVNWSEWSDVVAGALDNRTVTAA